MYIARQERNVINYVLAHITHSTTCTLLKYPLCQAYMSTFVRTLGEHIRSQENIINSMISHRGQPDWNPCLS
jgi:hypothetical protein